MTFTNFVVTARDVLPELEGRVRKDPAFLFQLQTVLADI